jgi:hypothetical protein
MRGDDPDVELHGHCKPIRDGEIVRLIPAPEGPLWKIWLPEIQAIEAELTAAGYAVVSREATEGMVDAAFMGGRHWEGDIKEIWQAMLKAAEDLPSQ